MKLTLLHAGSPARGPLEEVAADYKGRLSRHVKVDECFVRPSKHRDRVRGLADEGERLLGKLGPRDRLVALVVSERGWSSEHLAKRLESWSHLGATRICFALGSADGLAPSVVERAAERWSFGPMTLPHDLARALAWEQLYRANAILRGAPYHHA